jgi:hypothetical protein
MTFREVFIFASVKFSKILDNVLMVIYFSSYSNNLFFFQFFGIF